MLKRMYFLIFASMIFVGGCTPILTPGGGSDGTTKTEVQYYAVDGVKMIRSSIKDGTDPSTFLQSSYLIGPDSRILIRYESLSSHQGDIYLGDGHEMWMRVVLTNPADQAKALEQFRLCPVVKPWLILATWNNAHPFSKKGRWAQAGGDFDSAGCVKAVLDHGEKLPDETTETDKLAIYFKISRWYRDYIKGRGQNLGHILITTGPDAMNIIGDTSGSYSPRIQWSQVVISSDRNYKQP